MRNDLLRIVAVSALTIAGIGGPLLGRQDAPQAPASREDLDTIAIIAAFPETVESVMVIRGDTSDRQALSFRNFYPQHVRAPSNDPPEGEPDDLAELALEAMSETPWSLAALGGSDFERPRDLGAGNLNCRLVCQFDEPPTRLVER